MKNLLITTALFLYSLNLFGRLQNETEPQTSNSVFHSSGDASISLSGNMMMNDPFGPQFAGGVKIRIFLGKRVSVDYDLAEDKDYLHFGPGIIGLPLWILEAESGFSGHDDDSFILFLFKLARMALSAEHIAYHIPVKQK
jgi:hypothetical protein